MSIQGSSGLHKVWKLQGMCLQPSKWAEKYSIDRGRSGPCCMTSRESGEISEYSENCTLGPCCHRASEVSKNCMRILTWFFRSHRSCTRPGPPCTISKGSQKMVVSPKMSWHVIWYMCHRFTITSLVCSLYPTQRMACSKVVSFIKYHFTMFDSLDISYCLFCFFYSRGYMSQISISQNRENISNLHTLGCFRWVFHITNVDF